MFEFGRHFRERITTNPHGSVFCFKGDDADFSESGVFIGEVVAIMSPATFFAFDGRTGNRLGNGKQVMQIEGSVPTRVELTVAGDANTPRA